MGEYKRQRMSGAGGPFMGPGAGVGLGGPGLGGPLGVSGPPGSHLGSGGADFGFTGAGPGVPMGVGMHMSGLGLGMGLGFDGIFPAIKLRGLPFNVTEEDIRFFLGCDPVDLILVRRNQRLTGEAYVVLGAPVQIEFALQKNRTYMGKRYVEVFRAKKLDYYKAVVQYMTEGGADFERNQMPPQHLQEFQHREMHPAALQDFVPSGPPHMPPPREHPEQLSGTLKLRGLPFSATRDEIADWFNKSELQIQPVLSENVHIVMNYEGRPTGQAFVVFASPMDAEMGLAKDRQMMGSRYVELFQASREEFLRSTEQHY